MSFARPRHLKEATIASAQQRQLERSVEERCKDDTDRRLRLLVSRAAPKTLVNEDAFEKHQDLLAAKRAAHNSAQRKAEKAIQRANTQQKEALRQVEAKTDLNLRNSVAERSDAIHEKIEKKRHVEHAVFSSNKRKLRALVTKAKPKTDVVLAPELAEKQSALEHEKRCRQDAEQEKINAANKAAERRLRRGVQPRVFVDPADGTTDALGAHTAAHVHRLNELKEIAEAKKRAEASALAEHQKQLEQLAAAAKPKTVVALSAEHNERLESLTQQSEAKHRAHAAALRQHSRKLEEITTGSKRRIDLPPLGTSSSGRAGSARIRAATLIQAAGRRRSLMRLSEAARASEAARVSAVYEGQVEDEAAQDGPTEGAERPAIPPTAPKLVAKLRQALELAQNRHTQRRSAITPAAASAVVNMPVAAAA